MSAPRCVLRFRSAGNAGLAIPGGRALVDLFINDAPAPTGHIIWLEPAPGAPGRWAYVLADGRATGLQSVLSRQEIEGMVAEYHIGALSAERRRSA
jgi:hypothetical protein